MRLNLNGKAIDLEGKIFIAQFVEDRKLDPSKIVVELNGVILENTDWASTKLREADNLIIVSFVGGG